MKEYLLFAIFLFIYFMTPLSASDRATYAPASSSNYKNLIQKLESAGYVENKTDRSSDAKYFHKGEQSVVVKGGQPLHFKNEHNEWENIVHEPSWLGDEKVIFGIEKSPSKISVNTEKGEISLKANKSSFTFSSDIELQQIDKNGKILSTEKAVFDKFKVQNDQIIYENIFPGIDLEIQIMPFGLKSNFVVKKTPTFLPATKTIAIANPINSNSGKLLAIGESKNVKTIKLLSAYSDTLHFSPLLIYDNDKRNTDKHVPGNYNWEEGGKLLMSFEKSEVFNSKTQYPVTIDPFVSNWSFSIIPSCYYPSYYPAALSVSVPSGSILGKTYFETDFYAYNGAYTSEQRHYIQGPTATSPVFSGGSASGGYNYWTGFIDVAQGHVSTGSVNFTWYVSRTWGGSGCNTTYNYVDFRYITAFYGPCPNDNATPNIAVDRGSPSCGSFTSVNIGSGTYVEFDVVNGINYDFSTCGSSFDTEISGYNGSSGVFYNDDFGPDCPSADQASVNWTSNFTGTLRVLVDHFDPAVANCQGYNGSSAILKYKANGGPIGRWTGNGSDRYWENGSNWECGVVPNTSTDVVIPNTGNNPLIRNGITGNCNTIELQVTSGARLEVQTGGILNVTQ